MEYSEKIKVVKFPFNLFCSAPRYVFYYWFLIYSTFWRMDSRI